MRNRGTVIGVFESREHADMAVEELRAGGYTSDQISFIAKEIEPTVTQKSVAENVAEGAVGGAAGGSLVAGLAGLMVGIGALTIPGIGALFIGGPLAAALGLSGAAATTVSAAASGAVAGGLVGALSGLGLPNEVAQVYEEQVREGGIVLAVPIHDSPLEESQVVNIFTNHHASQVKTI